MSQCVPSWDVEDNSSNGRCLKTTFSNSMSANLDVPILDYEVAELTWKNGQLSMHGFGPPRLVYKSQANNGGIGHAPTWDKPRATETLEAIVDQATLQPHGKPQMDELVPWLGHDSSPVVGGSVTMTMDALVPQALLSGANTRVGSCSVDRSGYIGGGVAVAATHEWESVSCSETFGMESSRQMTSETELGVKGLTSVSMGSPQETVSAKRSTSPEDSVGHSKRQKNELEEKRKGKGKSSITTKRSRAAAIHNQSERKRRDKINEKMQTLQKLVPNANKTDKASMLDEVIEYLKQLQAQVQMMGRMNISPMMMPLAMQQLQMAMMNPVGMGIGMGMGMGMPGVMDLNTIGGSHPNIPAMPQIFHPSSIMQPVMASWDMNTFVDRVQSHNDPMAAFLATQSQPMTMEGYSRMAALFQHMQNQPCYSSGHKNGNN